jgi:hypothetical protein
MNPVDLAREFYAAQARDIDRALFTYHFGDLSQDEMLAVLARYQRDDGGFFGLEGDIAAPVSNPFATELALLICVQAGVPSGHPLLSRAVEYLERTQTDDGDWRLPPEAYEDHLAPWFRQWVWPNLNPACTIGGLLRQLGLGSKRLHRRVAALFERLAHPEEMVDDSFYSVRPYAYYFLAEGDHPQRDLYLSGLPWWLVRQHVAARIADSGHFFEYVRSSDTYTGRHLPAHILERRLEMLVAEQAEDGGWPSPYDPRWRGWATLQNLLVLRAFRRV